MSGPAEPKRELLETVEGEIRRGSLTCSVFPIEWFFEISKLCNIRCLTCGRLYDKRFEAPGFAGNMHIEILEEVSPFLENSFMVHSVGFGEPFVNRRALDFIREIKKHGVYLDVITNGTLLRGKEDALIESGLDLLIVSMDGGTRKVFEHFRKGALWDDVTGSLVDLNRMKQRSGAVLPEVIIEFVGMRGNIKTLPRLVKAAAKKWGAKGISVEALYQTMIEGYVGFYQEQNLSSMPFEKVESYFTKAKKIGDRHGVSLGGPYFEGDRKTLWNKARIKAFYSLDYPRPGIVVEGLADFHGWAVHPAGIEKITCRIGERAEKSARYGVERSDVSKDMNSVLRVDAKCGFVIPVEQLELDEGENTLHLSIHDCDGGVTKASPVPFVYKTAPEEGKKDRDQGGSCSINLDTPSPEECVMDDPYIVVGWCVPPLPAGMRVYLDKKMAGEALMGVDRPDIAKALDHPDAFRSGFFLPLDLAGVEDGSHRLCIVSVDASGETIDKLETTVNLKRGSCRDKRISSRARGAIETPSSGERISGKQHFIGWAVYGPDTERIRLLNKGKETGIFCHGFQREDIHERLGMPELTNRLGIGVYVDTDRLPEGEQTFVLAGISRDGKVEELSELACTVSRHEKGGADHDSVRPESSGLAATAQRKHVDADPSRKTVFSPYCSFPWTTTYVAFDGKIRPCCFSDPDEDLGDLKEQPFDAIWNGEAYVRFRREILEGKVPKPCRSCMADSRIHGRAIFDKFKDYL